MTKETIDTIQTALSNNLRKVREYAKNYPDGGWSQDGVTRWENALSDFLKWKDNRN